VGVVFRPADEGDQYVKGPHTAVARIRTAAPPFEITIDHPNPALTTATGRAIPVAPKRGTVVGVAFCQPTGRPRHGYVTTTPDSGDAAAGTAAAASAGASG
jgi:hypothetical protein